MKYFSCKPNRPVFEWLVLLILICLPISSPHKESEEPTNSSLSHTKSPLTLPTLDARSNPKMDDAIAEHHETTTSQHHHHGSTTIDITALDGIINVNSLFTLAVFIGLAWNPTDSQTLISCAVTAKVAEDLVTFHVFAFACFLFSSLVALCLKQAIRIIADNHNNGLHHHHSRPHSRYLDWAARVNRGLLRAGIVASAFGSVFGCGFLMLALVNVVQIKVGRLGCSGAAAGAIIPLVTLVPVAMLVYIVIVFHAFASSR